jgi:hypothetical protein
LQTCSSGQLTVATGGAGLRIDIAKRLAVHPAAAALSGRADNKRRPWSACAVHDRLPQH